MINLIFDGDTVIYRAASSCEHKVDWGGFYTIYSDHKECQQRFIAIFEEIMSNLRKHKKLTTYSVTMCVSDKKNFRKLLLPTYKANRNPKDEQLEAIETDSISYVSYSNPLAKLRKPSGYARLLQWVRENYHVVCYPYLEADDTCSLLSSPETILVSLDKDFCTIPETWFYNFYRDELMYNTQESADYFWLVQCIKGDPVDNYKGIKGFADKKAKKLFDTHGTSWETVVAAYEDNGYTKEDALVQARVARILRVGEYKNGKIFLWKSNKPIDTNVEPVVY